MRKNLRPSILNNNCEYLLLMKDKLKILVVISFFYVLDVLFRITTSLKAATLTQELLGGVYALRKALSQAYTKHRTFSINTSIPESYHFLLISSSTNFQNTSQSLGLIIIIKSDQQIVHFSNSVINEKY